LAGSPAVLKFPRGLPPTKQFGERIRLLVIQGQDKGVCYSVLGDLIFIGREGCQIQINDSNLSRKHAELGWQGDHYVIRDLGSANGIMHNGQKATEAKLSPGDLVMIGLTVLEVYPAGQTIRRDRPQLPGSRKLQVVAGGAGGGPAKPVVDPKKQAVERKRLMIILFIGFMAFLAYMTDETKTIKENAKIEPSEEETVKPRKKLKKDELSKLIAEYIPNYSLDTQQRRDAEVFFRSGVRELQNKNYRRAFTAFDTALTVDPSHDLAKIYLTSAKKEMMGELRMMDAAATTARKSLRTKEARMYYDNMIRYLEGETGDANAMDNEANKEMSKLYEKAKTALKELDKEENRTR
jgi:pSer/pThr/pTyr-binding forkhead associated (FHA) protein